MPPIHRSFLSISAVLLLASASLADEPTRYVFRKDTDRRVAFVRGEYIYFGKLDENGSFIEDQQARRVPHPVLPSGVIDWQYTRDVLKSAINVPSENQRTERVYEYRSGRLVLGSLTSFGIFIPEVGSKVIALGDYKYSKEAPRIYNLPGKFVPVDGKPDGDKPEPK